MDGRPAGAPNIPPERSEMADEFKALTVVHLPFVGKDGKTFQPGDTIKREHFETHADKAEELNPDADNPTADEQIKEMMKYGSISDDLDADLHPDHRPVDPNAPTLPRMIEQAKYFVEELGDKAPDEMKKLAAMEHTSVTTGDNGSGGDKS